jgi:hypothetical protein
VVNRDKHPSKEMKLDFPFEIDIIENGINNSQPVA